ncbi:hypothetical protein MLE99_02555 [Escherichia coli]|nr:hypothetical protein [Escherichia coli]
MSGVAEPC